MKKNELHPEAFKIINEILVAEKNGKRLPLYKLNPKEARKAYLDARASLSPPTPDIQKVFNFKIPVGNKFIKARYYRGFESKNKILPITIFFHGGGWVIGDLDTHDVICRQLVNKGDFDIISVDYSLAPENKFPTAIKESIKAIDFIAKNPLSLPYDTSKIVLCGDSAGGNIATVCSINAKIKKTPKISLQVLIYPAVHIGSKYPSKQKYDGIILSDKLMNWFESKYLQNKDLKDWRASPILYKNLKNCPPALIILAGCDPLRDEGEAYSKALKDAGNKVEVVEFKGQIHGFLTMGARISDTAKLIDLVIEKINSCFKK